MKIFEEKSLQILKYKILYIRELCFYNFKKVYKFCLNLKIGS